LPPAIYYFDTSLATPGREQILNNNTSTGSLIPVGTARISFPVDQSQRTWSAAQDDGTMKNFVAFRRKPAFFLEPMMHMPSPEQDRRAVVLRLPALLGFRVEENA